VEQVPVYRVEEDPRTVEIAREGGGWRLSGVSLERAAAMTYWEYDQSVRRFQRLLEHLGITNRLKEAGIRVGDSVFIGEHELEWEE
jgi:GTP-binding protein